MTGARRRRNGGSRNSGKKHKALQPSVGLHEVPAPWLRLLLVILRREDRLHLFQASKQFAGVVLQHAANVHLRVTTATSRAERTHQEHCLQAILAAAPDACDLHVILQGGAATLPASLPHSSITHISLQHTTITSQLLRQLQPCTRLHTLTLEHGCSMDIAARGISNLKQQRAAWLPPSLQHLRFLPRPVDIQPYTLASKLAPLLAPQLTAITVNPTCSERSGLRFLRQLPALARVHVTTILSEDVLEGLLAVEAPLQVIAGTPELGDGYARKACTWQQLQFTCIPSLKQLARLPLKAIQRTIIHGLSVGHASPQRLQYDIKQLAACTGLQCSPVYCPQVEQPVFCIAADPPAAPSIPVALINAVSSHLVGESVCLHLVSILAPAVAELPVWLLCLPPCVTALWFQWSGQELLQESYWRPFLAALPAHVTKVVLDHDTNRDISIIHAAELLRLSKQTQLQQQQQQPHQQWVQQQQQQQQQQHLQPAGSMQPASSVQVAVVDRMVEPSHRWSLQKLLARYAGRLHVVPPAFAD